MVMMQGHMSVIWQIIALSMNIHQSFMENGILFCYYFTILNFFSTLSSLEIQCIMLSKKILKYFLCGPKTLHTLLIPLMCVCHE